MTTQRTEPAITADERTMLEGWLDYHRRDARDRSARAWTDAQLRTASVPPSELSLLGLVRHMAEVERIWFRKVLVDDDPGPIYFSEEDPDGEFHLTEADTWEEAHGTWQAGDRDRPAQRGGLRPGRRRQGGAPANGRAARACAGSTPT